MARPLSYEDEPRLVNLLGLTNLFEVLVEPGHSLAPSIGCSFRPVAGPSFAVEPMPGAAVAMEFVGLPGFSKFSVHVSYVFRGRVGVFFAKEPQHWATDIGRLFQW